MKKTLLNTALANMTGALALTIMVGAGVAYADENEASQGHGNLALQDFGNESYNDNLSNNDVASHNDNDFADLDVTAKNVGNDRSHDDNDYVDADITEKRWKFDSSKNYYDGSESYEVDASVEIEDVALLVSHQQLVGVAALVNMGSYSGDVTTGSISYGAHANQMFAGNMTTSNNTGAGSVAQAASSIQANGTFSIGN